MNYNQVVLDVIYTLKNINQFIGHPSILFSAFLYKRYTISQTFYEDIIKISDSLKKYHKRFPNINDFLDIMQDLLINNNVTPLQLEAKVRQIPSFRSSILKVIYNLLNRGYENTVYDNRKYIISCNTRLPDILNIFIEKYGGCYFEGQYNCCSTFDQEDEEEYDPSRYPDVDEDTPTHMLVLPDNKVILATCSIITVWDVKIDKFEAEYFYQEDIDNIMSLSGNRLFVQSYDKYSSIIDLKGGKKIQTPHFYSESFANVDILPDGRLIFASEECRFKIWDSHTKEEILFGNGQTDDLAIVVKLLKNNRVVTATNNIDIWDLTTQSLEFTLKSNKHNQQITKIFELSDNRLLAKRNRNLAVWDLTTKQVTMSSDSDSNISGMLLLEDERLIVAYFDYIVKIWDLKTGQVLISHKFNIGFIGIIEQLPNNDILLASHFGIMGVWNLDTLKTNFDTYERISAIKVLSDNNSIIIAERGGGVINILN